MEFHIKRIIGYLFGFVLFYAPFALFQKTISYLLTGQFREMTIHSLCYRIPIEHMLDGSFFQRGAYSLICCGILFVSALLFGPVFCGRLCPAGAFTEYVSKLVPDGFKISWRKYTEIAPLRYGMLFGFLLSPFFDMVLACAYCNFFIFDLIVNYLTMGYIVSFTSSMLLTFILWLFLFGIFTKVGRGFCNFLCPVGAVQSLFSYIGSKIGIASAWRCDTSKCTKCGKCANACPMEAIEMNEGPVQSIHNCINCGVCVYCCPVKSITFGRKNEK